MSRLKPDRQGFILGYVVIMGFIVGALAVAFFTARRHHDAQIRRGGDDHRARFLARGTLEYLRFALREKLLRRHPGQDPDVRGGEFHEFILADPTSLEKFWREKAPSDREKDHRDFFKQLLGESSLRPIDDLVARFPDATVTLRFDLDRPDLPLVTPLAPGSAIVDPVLKRLNFRLECRARVRKARSTYTIAETLRVDHQLPTGKGKFTLALLRTEEAYHNGHLVSEKGEDQGGLAPVVLIHNPVDGDPLNGDPFKADVWGTPLLSASLSDDPRRWATELEDRGFVYISSRDPVFLNLASGAGPAGEYHTIYKPESKPEYPVATKLAEQPQNLEGFRAPAGDNVFQSAWVQGAVFGFYEGFARDLLPLNLPPDAPGPMSSTLRIFGTPAMPSGTLVYGEVFRRLGAISGLAIDRDDTTFDENEQYDAVKIQLPQREAIDPFFRNIDEDPFQSDATLEAQEQPPANLIPFSSPGFGPYRVRNVNLQADTNDDGLPDAIVASEMIHNPLALDRGYYKYSTMFDGYGDYARYMSKLVDIPANACLELATQKAPKTFAALAELAFARPDVGQKEDRILTDIVIDHQSAFHQRIGKEHGHFHAIDTLDGGRAGLERTFTSGIPGEREIVFVEGEQEFKRRFLRSGLDLMGLEVRILPSPDGSSPSRLVFEGPVSVQSGGIIQVDEFRVTALNNPKQGVDFESVEIRCNRLVLLDRGPVDAAIVTPKVVTEGDAEYSVIRGSLVAVGPATSEMTRPLILAWDPRIDPTKPTTTVHYRGRFEFNAGHHEWVEE